MQKESGGVVFVMQSVGQEVIMEKMPGWLRVAAILAVVFGIVGLIAGAWMFAPVIVLGLIGLLMLRTREP